MQRIGFAPSEYFSGRWNLCTFAKPDVCVLHSTKTLPEAKRLRHESLFSPKHFHHQHSTESIQGIKNSRDSMLCIKNSTKSIQCIKISKKNCLFSRNAMWRGQAQRRDILGFWGGNFLARKFFWRKFFWEGNFLGRKFLRKIFLGMRSYGRRGFMETY